jgi:hypothetical protein
MLEATGETTGACKELELAAALYGEKRCRPGSLRVAQRLASIRGSTPNRNQS